MHRVQQLAPEEPGVMLPFDDLPAEQVPTKRCSQCGVRHPVTEFYARAQSDRSHGDGLMAACKACTKVRADRWRQANPERHRYFVRRANRAAYYRDRKQITNHGLTLEKYEELLAEQSDRCASCGREFGPDLKPQIDHDHACCSGKRGCAECVRGLLCGTCNGIAGRAGDDPAWLITVACYLLRKSSAELEWFTPLP
jgi:hypothetical protein